MNGRARRRSSNPELMQFLIAFADGSDMSTRRQGRPVGRFRLLFAIRTG